MSSHLTFIISTVLVGLSAARISHRIFPYQPLQSLLSFLSLGWIIITVLQLVMGLAGLLSSIAMLFSCVAFCVGEYLWSSRRPVFERESQKDAIVSLSSLGIGVTIAVGFLGLLPLSGVLSEIWSQVRSVQPLSWDVVSYHLPNAVTYLQARSWLLIQGTYGHYPGGNELLNLWSMMFLQNESLLGLTTLTLVLGSLLATTVIFNLVVPVRSIFWRGIFSLGIILGLLNLSEFQNLFFDIARNDSTMMFWELVALWALLKSKTRVENWSIVTGVALGMLIGTKPNGLYFLIAALILNLVFSNSELEESLPDRIKGSLFKLLMPSLAIGGGWYVRNLIQTGQLTPPDQLKAAADLSIVQNLTNPALYAFNLPFTIVLVATIVSLIPLIIAVVQRINSSQTKPLESLVNRSVPLGIQIVAAWNLSAIVALVLTPSGAGYLAGAGKVFLIQVRYSAVIMPLTLILLGYALVLLIDPLLQPKPWIDALQRRSNPIASKMPLLITSCIAVMLMLLQSSTYRSPQGLPGHDGILFPGGQQQSKVYAWVQENVKNSVIYSVGLRPYGLVGEDFSNRVIDRLGSAGWTLAEGLPIMKTNGVKYLVICVDPFARSAPSGLKDVINQPGFKLVFQDELAVVFKLN